MAKYTENIRLAQPEGSDYYDIEVFNHNSELIDKKIGEMDNSLSTIKEGATREKAGIVQYGTTEGKALEGMMLARLAGCVAYGGDIQNEGVKDLNYLYYDRNTRKMYKCINQNNDTSANVNNFIPLDNNSIAEKLNGLIDTNETIRIGNIVIETVNVVGLVGLRKGYITTNFKKIFSINLCGFVNKGQNEEYLMRQVMHSVFEEIKTNKYFEFYCAGNQTVVVTIIGEI